jgi:predicted nucleic acid-binding protein
MLAAELSRRHRIRIFDGMILASAILSGARTLLSEDMQDGRVVESVTIRNPFAGL